MLLKLVPDVCICGDDRRERAQSDSLSRWSQNILRPSPPLSDETIVLERGWHIEASADIWLLNTGLFPCKNLICLAPPYILEDDLNRCWWRAYRAASASGLTTPAHVGLPTAVVGYTCELESGINWVPEKDWIKSQRNIITNGNSHASLWSHL